MVDGIMHLLQPFHLFEEEGGQLLLHPFGDGRTNRRLFACKKALPSNAVTPSGIVKLSPSLLAG